MRRIIATFLAAALTLSMTACGNSANESGEGDMPSSEVQQNQASAAEESARPESERHRAEYVTDEGSASNILIAYFSWADNAILEEDVDAVTSPSVIAPGNVQELAGWVQEETDGDLFPIRVTEPYSSDWDACLERANQERGDNARPALELWPIMRLGATWSCSTEITTKIRLFLNWDRLFPVRNLSPR